MMQFLAVLGWAFIPALAAILGSVCAGLMMGAWGDNLFFMFAATVVFLAPWVYLISCILFGVMGTKSSVFWWTTISSAAVSFLIALIAVAIFIKNPGSWN